MNVFRSLKWPASRLLVLFVFGTGTLRAVAQCQPGWVLSHQKISSTEGGFTGILDYFDYFGRSVVSLGDLDGDGVVDLAVGAYGDDDGGTDYGAVWVLFLNADGTVKFHQKISAAKGGFTGILDERDQFGDSLASLGDLDGDGVADLAVGARDDDGGEDRGAVWLLFLNMDGTVKSHQKISDTAGGFTGVLDDEDRFGSSVASLGDLDGDGVRDLAVGAFGDDDGGRSRGAVWVLFLNTDGTVKSHQKLSSTEGGFTGIVNDGNGFGFSVASRCDLDGDGVADLAVGAAYDGDGGASRGAAWILFLNSDGTVRSHQKISDTQGGFAGILDDWDHFAYSTAWLGDLDGDGVRDLAVGAIGDDDGGNLCKSPFPPSCDFGAMWVLLLNRDGTVKSQQKISSVEGGFHGFLIEGDYQNISSIEGGFSGFLFERDYFGAAVAVPGDLNGDGVADLAVGAPGDNDGGPNKGAVWVLFLDGVTCDPCDMNCDGDINALDIEPFLDLLFNGATPCNTCTGDTNGDGSIDALDIEPFLECLSP